MSRPVPTPKPASGRPGSTVIGVLGGIASGKSEAARLLAGSRGVVLGADEFAAQALSESSTADWLRAEFGPGVLTSAGTPDRKILSRLVFSDSAAREKLESWIHPLVREMIMVGLAEARATERTPIVLDVPLLLENEDAHGLAGKCDFLVFIETDAEERDRRAQERRGWAPGEVNRREQVQTPLSEKRTRARHVIENRTGLAQLKARVNEVLEAEQLPL